MKVSIITPIFNGEKYIERCINSLINQTYKNIEIIIVNDGSIDNTKEILNKYKDFDSRIKIVNQKNYGQLIARKNGINVSSGDYLMFVDIDDWIEPDTIEKLISYIYQYNADVIKYNYIMEPSKKNCKVFESTENIVINEENKNIIYDLLIDTYKFNNLWNQIVKKELCIDFKEHIDLRMGEDFLFNCEIITKSKKIVVVTDTFYHYIVNHESATHKIDYNKTKKNINDVFYVANKKIQYMGKWNLNNITKRVGIKLLDFLTDELFKVYKNRPMNYKELNNIYSIIFKQELYKEIIQTIRLKDIKDKKILRIIFKKAILSQNIKIMNCYILLVKIKETLKNLVKRKM